MNAAEKVSVSKLLSEARVAVHCASCGALAEAFCYGRSHIVGPLTEESLERHLRCDLPQLFKDLDETTRDLSAEWAR